MNTERKAYIVHCEILREGIYFALVLFSFLARLLKKSLSRRSVVSALAVHECVQDERNGFTAEATAGLYEVHRLKGHGVRTIRESVSRI